MNRNKLRLDIETRSRVDLKAHGVYRYVECPDFRILMCGWSFDGSPVRVETDPDRIARIPGLYDPEVEKIAHNSAFERICFSRFSGLPTGSYLEPEQWTDTEALAGVLGYPRKLEKLAPVLGAEPKDPAGTRLINFFCKPNRNGEWNRPEDHPEKWLEFMMYCGQDVETLIEVERLLPEWPARELEIFLADQKVNDRGFRVDLDLARKAHDVAQENRVRHEDEVRVLTGIANPGSQPQLLGWFQEAKVGIPDIKAETIEKALLRPDLPPVERRVLELRQELAGTAISKFPAALGGACEDGRMRGRLRYFGAHTGRWSGRGLQPQNLPRESLTVDCPHSKDPCSPCIEARTDAAILDLYLGLGADPTTLKALVRSLLLGPLTVVDYSAIEARVIAWLAGEWWAINAFNAGRDIYVETAERMGGLTRAQGKVAVLALGFAGGRGSLRAMGAQGTDTELDFLVKQWRRANPKIVRMWGNLEDSFGDGGKLGRLEVVVEGRDRLLVLPSGRAICYRNVRWERFRDRKTGKPKEAFRFDDPRGFRQDTYGGRLAENATQAVARDLLAEALVRLEDNGFRAVAHVHDEIIVEGDHPVDSVKKIMVAAPSWATELPIDGEGFTCRRYRKG